ncbi:hypothetical protein POJ06DRAFT_35464 [Lipomyces tetrasporus]|uniref:Uncharacterized protein n=1 Tax=Lipomyces tetrasporus TaxID=54092 RepID=A0AAD7QM53_9ASCO|nr:uncharacterized protein POJ06DRAFT_35464 [Lipomyces tetrasporus]KAJ8097608.1 hypothetical protein POJ06DRAFT_35464 [Lipomyces tetrasporus]
MTASSQVARRVLGDVSANIMHSPHIAINKPVDILGATVDCSPKGYKTGQAQGFGSKVALDGNVEIQSNIGLPSSPQQRSTQDMDIRHAPETDENPHSHTTSSQSSPRPPVDPVARRYSCKEHADRLRMRLRLAIYKVKINQTTTPLGDLPLPPSASQREPTTLTSSISPLMSSSHISLDSETFAGSHTIAGMRAASLYNADANVSASIAAMRLQSLPAVMSDAAIRIATGVSNRAQLPRRKKMGSFIHHSSVPHSTSVKSASRAANHSFDTAANNGGRKGNLKKGHGGPKRTRHSGAIAKDFPKKRTRRVTLAESSVCLKDDSVIVVTPARKRSSLPDKRLPAVPKLGADAEGSSGIFSSPYKSQLPSSAIKGTPGQIGAARSLLELGCL